MKAVGSFDWASLSFQKHPERAEALCPADLLALVGLLFRLALLFLKNEVTRSVSASSDFFVFSKEGSAKQCPSHSFVLIARLLVVKNETELAE